jgi:transposase
MIGPSGKKSGGQTGHRGETLRLVEEPDATIEHYPETCAACGGTLTAAMADRFGVKLVTATIARISQDCAPRFQGFADVVRDHVAATPAKRMDETGFRIRGKTQWRHIAPTVWLTFYRISAPAYAGAGSAGQPAGKGDRHYRA